MSPKPVYEQLKSLIKGAWWTNADGMTNSKGEFDTRAFFGTHKVAVELPDGQTRTREIQWKRGERNLFAV
jgi:hypothetical protein